MGRQDDLPQGFLYQADLLTAEGEADLVRELHNLPFQPFDFHAHLATRRVVGFGLHCDFDRRAVVEAPPIRDFLIPLRDKVAAFAGRPAPAFHQVLLNEYREGAGIGWHRDKPHFEDVAGVSLLAPCNFRLRRKNGVKWDRRTIIVEPRSAYLMTGAARNDWEHSISLLSAHRYSITLRPCGAEQTEWHVEKGPSVVRPVPLVGGGRTRAAVSSICYVAASS
jgi:alkylated DNA repair dioxygenase AlkB